MKKAEAGKVRVFFLQEIMIMCNLLSDLVGQLELVPMDQNTEVGALLLGCT